MSRQLEIEEQELDTDWTYEDAFPSLWGLTPSAKSSLKRQHVQRMSQYKNKNPKAVDTDNRFLMPIYIFMMKLQYCQFLCCLSNHLLKHPTVVSQERMLFKMDGVVTDCYWFELIYHLTLLVRMLNEDKFVANEMLIQSSNVNIRGFIGCYHYLNTIGVTTCVFLENMPEVRPAFTTLQREFEVFRCRALRVCLHEAYHDDKAHSDVVLYSNTLLQCKSHMDHKDVIQRECGMDINKISLLASALYLREEGEFSDAITILESHSDDDIEFYKHLAQLRHSLISTRIRVDVPEDESERTVEKALQNPKIKELIGTHDNIMRTGISPITMNAEISELFRS